MFVQCHVTHERLLQILTTGESMRFEHFSDTPVEALHHAIGSGRAWLGQAVFNVQCLAQLAKLVVARGLALTAGKQPADELFAVVSQNFLHLDRANLVQGLQERSCGSGRLVTLDLNKHPPGGAVNGYKQVPPAGFIGHLGQIFDIDVDERRLVAFEGFVKFNGLFGLDHVEVANALATQATIKTRARGLRAKKLAGDGQQITQGQQQHLSEFDHDLFLRGCGRGLPPLRGVGRVTKAVSAPPLVNGAFTHAITQRKSCSGLGASGHLNTGGGLSACVVMQGNLMTRLPAGLLW